MDIDALKQALKQDIANGKKPFAVIATAGTTNTGSIDPLPEIATICQQHHLWMHVDGAFGASILLSEKCRPLLKGIEQSDSLSWDAHKWLMQTYGMQRCAGPRPVHPAAQLCYPPGIPA